MSSQALVRTNGLRPNVAGPALLALFGHIKNGPSAFARRFMEALRETRQRQANLIIRKYRHVIDDSND